MVVKKIYWTVDVYIFNSEDLIDGYYFILLDQEGMSMV
ncbi:MAG: hypothetical protein CM15mP22_0460 [Gammaproteobacteria bacterium]|nr:MAG: hypothetical protein CM15mP22_0460 [Gammaproteobacteria bacterium]